MGVKDLKTFMEEFVIDKTVRINLIDECRKFQKLVQLFRDSEICDSSSHILGLNAAGQRSSSTS